MQLLFDFLPIFAFFVAYKLSGLDIIVATKVLIAATVLQLAVHWIRTRKVKPLHLVSAGLVLAFGGLTIALDDSLFIKWKPTILYWLLAAAFGLSLWPRLSDRPLAQRLMTATGAEIELSPPLWRRLTWAWVGFFAVLGAANLVVFRLFDEETWVNFKLFGLLGLTLAFAVAQGFWIASRAERDDTPPG